MQSDGGYLAGAGFDYGELLILDAVVLLKY